MIDISRDQIYAYVEEARERRVNKVEYVRARLLEDYPGIEAATVRRNGASYNLLEYLLDDVRSYGTSA